jgi:hypothetical protein
LQRPATVDLLLTVLVPARGIPDLLDSMRVRHISAASSLLV